MAQCVMYAIKQYIHAKMKQRTENYTIIYTNILLV